MTKRSVASRTVNPTAASRSVAITRSASRVRTDLPFAALDALLAAGAYFVVLVLRFDAAVPAGYWGRFGYFLPFALGLHLFFNTIWGLYGEMWRHASVAEARRVLQAGASTVAALGVAFAFDVPVRTPASVVFLGCVVATMLAGVVRFQSRLFAVQRGRERGAGLRVAVVGAGEAGGAIVREMQRNPEAGLRPVAIFDDERRKHRLCMAGVPVVGSIDDLPGLAEELELHQVLLAIPSASAEDVRRVADAADMAKLPLKVLPGMKELVGSNPTVRDVRDLQIEDLLGREQVATDLDQVRRLIEGRTVLITGAGGSIGSEIARQVAQFDPHRLLLLDHDETHLHDASSMIDFPTESVLADIRDTHLIGEIFRRQLPEVVFHAAAHKHVPLLESHPCEAVRTNVMGTRNVVEAAASVGVERLVFISTDKAVQPSSLMGASKWIGEQLILGKAPAGAPYCAVRFGNVLGSRGSVIPTFARQIAAGGPVTVTDPRMTRFFMSVREAVQLVLQASAFAKGGEVFMLEMGEPVNILELAEKMIRLSGRAVGTEIPIRITGRRPGEKLEEELRAPTETPHPTPHDSIVRLYPERLDPDHLDTTLLELQMLAEERRNEEAAHRLLDLTRTVVLSDKDKVVLDLTTLERSDTWSRSST